MTWQWTDHDLTWLWPYQNPTMTRPWQIQEFRSLGTGHLWPYAGLCSKAFSLDIFKWLYLWSNSFKILVSKGEFDLGQFFVSDVEAVHFLAKLWSWQTHLSTHHNHVTPLMHLMHLMHLLARFPQHRARCANKNYWFCSCGHFLASSGNYRKDGHYKSFFNRN